MPDIGPRMHACSRQLQSRRAVTRPRLCVNVLMRVCVLACVRRCFVCTRRIKRAAAMLEEQGRAVVRLAILGVRETSTHIPSQHTFSAPPTSAPLLGRRGGFATPSPPPCEAWRRGGGGGAKHPPKFGEQEMRCRHQVGNECALLHRAEVRVSFMTTTVRGESQVTPQGRHR